MRYIYFFLRSVDKTIQKYTYVKGWRRIMPLWTIVLVITVAVAALLVIIAIFYTSNFLSPKEAEETRRYVSKLNRL